MLVGASSIDKINSSRIIVFGAGGVGSYAIEAIARCGVSVLDVVDGDDISTTNINRQLFALHSTIGKKKTTVAKERITDISPETSVTEYTFFYDFSTKNKVDLSKYDYIIDAIDSMESKILLIKEANKVNTPIISAMSTGNKTDIFSFKVTDIYNTSVCPIAKILRKRLREENITQHKVIYSTQTPITPDSRFVTDEEKRTVGSVSYVPPAVGLMLASVVMHDILEKK